MFLRLQWILLTILVFIRFNEAISRNAVLRRFEQRLFERTLERLRHLTLEELNEDVDDIKDDETDNEGMKRLLEKIERKYEKLDDKRKNDNFENDDDDVDNDDPESISSDVAVKFHDHYTDTSVIDLLAAELGFQRLAELEFAPTYHHLHLKANEGNRSKRELSSLDRLTKDKRVKDVIVQKVLRRKKRDFDDVINSRLYQLYEHMDTDRQRTRKRLSAVIDRIKDQSAPGELDLLSRWLVEDKLKLNRLTNNDDDLKVSLEKFDDEKNDGNSINSDLDKLTHKLSLLHQHLIDAAENSLLTTPTTTTAMTATTTKTKSTSTTTISKTSSIDSITNYSDDENINDNDDDDNNNNKQMVVINEFDDIRNDDEHHYHHDEDEDVMTRYNDRYFQDQWNLVNRGQEGGPSFHDIHVLPVWRKGFSGTNITIVIIDDGIDHRHKELKERYRPDVSYDLNDPNDPHHDPMPRTMDRMNNHGTKCAGAAAAQANNCECGVGVAHTANIGGIRILDGPVTDLLEARALSYKNNDVDIKSASWGPTDDGRHMDGPRKFAKEALFRGATEGRNGKGMLYVWATGNGGSRGDDCSADGYVSSIYVISIGSINSKGESTYYSERCPSTLAVTYTGGSHDPREDPFAETTKVVTSDVDGKCDKTFQGTSSAAPLVGGALAVVLEANPDLTYRDIMHIIIRTSVIPTKTELSGWTINGAGYHCNDKFGFGTIDLGSMVEMAQHWNNFPNQLKEVVELEDENDSVRLLPYSGVLKVPLDVKLENIEMLEHVVANISISFVRRGDIQLTLTSPSGTSSEMLSFRHKDKTAEGINYFPFMTTHNWGEHPNGKWNLTITTINDLYDDRMKEPSDTAGKLNYFSLIFYGTKKHDPIKTSYHEKRQPRMKSVRKRAYNPNQQQIDEIYDEERRRRSIVDIEHNEKVLTKKEVGECNENYTNYWKSKFY
ncbi:hypothetical protein SNEBB_011349 [Seison nebaliae]|nr:hypothetical protein SNEBB_011349 [Seison nebaliae]